MIEIELVPVLMELKVKLGTHKLTNLSCNLWVEGNEELDKVSYKE